MTSKKLLTTIGLAAGVLALSTGACKNAEKKRRTGGETTDPGKAAQGGPATGAPTGGQAASPHGGTASPHGGTASPHGGAAGAPHGGGGPMVGGSVTAQPTAEDGSKVLGPMTATIPKAWKESPPSSGMRLAQWAIGDKDPAELVAYHFPGGGSVDANLDRWYGQFKQADGSSSKDKANRKDEIIDGLEVTTVNVKGHYVAAMRPGQPGNHDKPDHQMLAAIITTDKGPIFFKMTGPEKTVTAAEKDWAAFIASIRKSK